MLGDVTFKNRFRVDPADFKVLVELMRLAIEGNETMGALLNGTIPVEYQLPIASRWLAGASIFEGMHGHVFAKSTAYAIVCRVVAALNACRRLDCNCPVGEDTLESARQFKARSEHQVIKKALGAMAGLFVRLIKSQHCETMPLPATSSLATREGTA